MKLDHIKEYPVVLSQDVIWGDMDAFGHINNTVYYDYANGKSCEIPEAIVAGINALEG